MAPVPGGSDYLPGMPYDHFLPSGCACDGSSERVLAALCGTLRCAHRRPRRAVLPPHRARPAADHRTLHLPPPPAVLCARRSARIGVCTRTRGRAHARVSVPTRGRACACAQARVRTCACVCKSAPGARACECHRVCQRASVLASVPCSKRTTRRNRSLSLAVPHNGAVAARAPRGAGGAAVVPSS